jgi:hypothetical protein
LARPKRFELLTPRFVVWCSIQLSYGRVVRIAPKCLGGCAGRTGRQGARNGVIAIASVPRWQGRRKRVCFQRVLPAIRHPEVAALAALEEAAPDLIRGCTAPVWR